MILLHDVDHGEQHERVDDGYNVRLLSEPYPLLADQIEVQYEQHHDAHRYAHVVEDLESSFVIEVLKHCFIQVLLVPQMLQAEQARVVREEP